jgi:hypothetical protein
MSDKPECHAAPAAQPEVAFLLRCWREGDQWRFLLENVATRERLGFEHLQAICRHLEEALRGPGWRPAGPGS